MTSKVFTIHPDQTVEEAMELMDSKHCRHLPVVDNDNDTVVGMISLGDVVRTIIYKQREEIRKLENRSPTH